MNKSSLIKSLQQRGFPKKILKAFEEVKREIFIPSLYKNKAYEDIPLPIGNGQTISQPYTIAVMLDLLDLKPSQKVLEIGSGRGYVLALLSGIVGKSGKVYGVERIKQLVDKSKKSLESYKNVKAYNKNGFFGLPDKAPFDRILISAACESVPKKLLLQLKNNGILVAPVDSDFDQDLVVIQKKTKNNFIIKEKIPGFRFVRFVRD